MSAKWKRPRYIPNLIPAETRLWNGFLAVSLVLYGAYGLWRNDIWAPGRHSRGVHFQGLAAWVFYCAMLMAVAVLIAEIVDHHDRRDNEHLYRRFRTYATRLGWTLFWIAGVLTILDSARCGCTVLG